MTCLLTSIYNILIVEEREFIKSKANAGSPPAEFTYGLYYLLNERAMRKQHKNGEINSSIIQMVMPYGLHLVSLPI